MFTLAIYVPKTKLKIRKLIFLYSQRWIQLVKGQRSLVDYKVLGVEFGTFTRGTGEHDFPILFHVAKVDSNSIGKIFQAKL